MHGLMGKILNVDLGNSRISYLDTQSYADKFLGGRGIASRIYWDNISPETKAFDPDNLLIFINGTLVASGALAANRMIIAGKSPMTLPEGFCYGNIGGFFGAELKKAGYDGIVIKGCAPRPVYLWINNGDIEIRDATWLWGLGTYQTGKMLRHIHGEKARFIATGVAGERLVRTAIIFGSHESTATGGFGAVMGSKNLKAVVTRGTGSPTVVNPSRLKELNLYTVKMTERLQQAVATVTETGPYLTRFKHADLEVIGKGGCYQCGLKCSRNLLRYDNRLEGYRRCQAMVFYQPWEYGRDNEPVDTFFHAPELANDYGICTMELAAMIHWLFRCFQEGTLKEEDTKLPLARIGTQEFLEKLLHLVAYREGLGDILADGLVRAADKVPIATRTAFHNLASVGHIDGIPPRVFFAHALIYPFEPRMHPLALHELSWVRWAWLHNLEYPQESPITSKVVYDIAKVYWGSEEAGDFATYEGKALAAKRIQNRCYIKDSLGLCDMGWTFAYSLSTPDHVRDPDLEAKIFEAVTGVRHDNINTYGDRIFNLQRAILLREGRKIPDADYPNELNFTQPFSVNRDGRKMPIPGRREGIIDTTGNILDRQKFTVMLKEFYRLRGWDEDTGIPLQQTLTNLGLDDLIGCFPTGPEAK